MAGLSAQMALSALRISAVATAFSWLLEIALEKWQAARGVTFQGAPVPMMTKDRAIAVFHVSPLQDGYSLEGGSLAGFLSSGGLSGVLPGILRIEAHPDPRRGPGHMRVVCYRAADTRYRTWIKSVEQIGILFSPWRRRYERRMRLACGIAAVLAALAGPEQEAWATEWPAHLAGIEPSRWRAARIVWHTAGFARAALTWRLSRILARPAVILGRVVDGFLRSDTLCTLLIVAAVAAPTRWSEQTAGPGAAAGVLIASTASALTAINQARKFRGIKKSRRSDKSSAK